MTFRSNAFWWMYSLAILQLFSCRDVKQIDFSSLTEEQKRLPENALSSMTVTKGLSVELFASEPMVTNPTNISVDSKGRVWVCEAYNYDVTPDQTDTKGDRIIVLEDTDGDGKADKKTIFYQGKEITTPLGILALGNKVYVTRSPLVYVFSDDNGDLIADKKDSIFTNLGRKGDHSGHSLFPGPDGRLYFSTGNYAGAIQDKMHRAIVDKAGFEVNQTGQPYLGGMVMSFSDDGKEFEVLGHNFRNNYEPCIDSYGSVWQSDNDDDGNASTRINFVMPYGNYGFLDEMTRASWRTNRINQEETIPERHWHQNDPGVVPNVLITGAGSPAGMTIYEGSMLPNDFAGMPLHAEPYYNVVRSYITSRSGAGYTATIKDVLKSVDQWFRPVDVCTAPDGSLFVADWYDPILGGGAAGDAVQGRIYRVASNATSYDLPAFDLSNISSSIEALKSPNIEARFMAFQKLVEFGDAAVVPLTDLWNSSDVLLRARAFWLLVKIKKDDSMLRQALKDADPLIRVAAVKAVLQNQEDVVPYLSMVEDDNDAGVRREAATSLRYAHTPEAAKLWCKLASAYDGKDRWYLEALGIGSDLHADLYFKTWLETTRPDLANKEHQDIIWRVRSDEALSLLAELIKNAPDVESTRRYFRAFDFHKGLAKNKVLESLLSSQGKYAADISMMALQQMDVGNTPLTSTTRRALSSALTHSAGTIAFVNLVSKYGLKDRNKELLKIAIDHSSDETGAAAIDLLIRMEGFDLIAKTLAQDNSSSVSLLKCLNGKGNKTVLSDIATIVADSTNSLDVRTTAVQTLGSSWPGEEKLLDLVRQGKIETSLEPIAASVLFNVYRRPIQIEAEKYLKRPTVKGKTLPSIKHLMASSGDVTKGGQTFNTYCTPCHQVQTNGKKFGPQLDQIGNKLTKEGLYRAVLFPDDGISHGFETTALVMNDGNEVLGILSSETDNEIELRQPGGISSKFSKPSIKTKEHRTFSLMPSLASSMSEQELVDLVSFLSTLK
ncbi:MAG TPA: PVC-type heme-binding CxxCH protein [Chryseolinea sp.]